MARVSARGFNRSLPPQSESIIDPAADDVVLDPRTESHGRKRRRDRPGIKIEILKLHAGVSPEGVFNAASDRPEIVR
jgi:hypothetical protein